MSNKYCIVIALILLLPTHGWTTEEAELKHLDRFSITLGAFFVRNINPGCDWIGW